ncbi:hypothetical protein E2542_SST18324 [Spatholobus suberectus]|nr:hypothetical protein E2542_SST18324 [Spatholobus suberectus]
MVGAHCDHGSMAHLANLHSMTHSIPQLEPLSAVVLAAVDSDTPAAVDSDTSAPEEGVLASVEKGVLASAERGARVYWVVGLSKKFGMMEATRVGMMLSLEEKDQLNRSKKRVKVSESETIGEVQGPASVGQAAMG